VNCLTNTGCTPLHLAAYGNHTDCVILLLAYGTDDSIVDNSGRTPLQISKCKDKNALKKLTNSGGKH